MRPSIPRDVSIAMLDVGGKATNLITTSSGSKASSMTDSVWGLKSFADMALSSLDSERCTKVSRGKLRRWNHTTGSAAEPGEVSPFVSFPSREMQANVIVHSLRDAQSGLFVLVTVEGGAFLGKSRLVAECIQTETETLSRQMDPFTVLESFRTSLDSHQHTSPSGKSRSWHCNNARLALVYTAVPRRRVWQKFILPNPMELGIWMC